ncbi:rod shape-determining protein MreD [bacterium]|nr:rod shape-determining protein MreD [bacterium]
MKKFLILIGFSLLAILLQLVVAPWFSIQGIKPDFILVLVMFVAILYGRVYGQLYGFGFGLIVDMIGIGSFLGLSAMVKSIAGFLTGYLKGRRNRFNSFTLYTFTCFIIFFHYLIFFLINFHSTDYSIQFLVVRYILPETIYTSVLFIVFDYILSLSND